MVVVLPQEVTAAARRFEHAAADTAHVCRGVGLWYASEGQPLSSAYMLLSSWLLDRLKVTAMNLSTGLLRHDYLQPTAPGPPRMSYRKMAVSWEDDTVMSPILADALCAPADYVERHLEAFLIALERERGALFDHHRTYAETQHDTAIELCENAARALHGLADTAGRLATASGRDEWNLQLASISLPETVIEELQQLNLSGVVIEQITRSMPLPRAIEQPHVITTTMHHLQQASNRLGNYLQEWATSNEHLAS